MEIHNKNILCKLFLPDVTKDHEKLKKYLYRGWRLEKYEEFVTWSTDIHQNFFRNKNNEIFYIYY